MFREEVIIDPKKCRDILEKTEPQKSEQEKDYIKTILQQTFLFKQLQEEIKFQQQELERESCQEIGSKGYQTNNILDIDVLLNRTQRNIKYMRVPNNSFLFHKGDAGDRLYIIIKGHAAVYAEREKNLINQDLSKEKNLTKQVQLLTSKILHFEHQAELKSKKIQDDISMEQLLQQQMDSETNEECDNEQIISIKKQQRTKEEAALAQINNTITELKQEIEGYSKELKNLITSDQEILKGACGEHKELIGKYFTSQSTTGNVCYYTKLKTLDPFNHLGEASIITNEKRTATVMACSSPNPSSMTAADVISETPNCNQSCETQESLQNNTLSSFPEEDDEDLHLFYLEANIFVGLFSATLDQINFPLTVLSKILTHTSKDLLVRISYLFKLNEHKFNSQIFTEGIDYANCVYLVKKGSVQLSRLVKQDEADTALKEENQMLDDVDHLKMKIGKKATNIKKQVVIAVVGEGQFFGLEDIQFKKREKMDESGDDTERLLDKKQKRTCSAVALTSCLIYSIPKSILFTSSYQFIELQKNFIEQSKAKSQFYLNQTEKNNKIQHYLEQEINRINQQPQVEKTLIQMSMNHHKQMMIETNKISNMMDSYIKGNKDILNHQKEILQMVHGRDSSATKDRSKSSNHYSDKFIISSPTKVDYGRVKELSSRNSAEIVYAHMVQQENEKALNIKENTVLSVMPQTQQSVKDILRAQRYYSKSKDAHNKNIRLPSRQNLNSTVFISQSQSNIMSLNQINNSEKPQAISTKCTNNIGSLSEFDDTLTNPQYKIERKNNMISVKKIKQLNTQVSSIFNTPSLAPLKDQETQTQNDFRQKQLKSLNSTTYNSPSVNPAINQMKKTHQSQLKSMTSNNYNSPTIGPLNLETDNVEFEFNDNTETLQSKTQKQNKPKVLFSLSSLKTLDLDSKQFYHSSSMPKYNISDKNIFSKGDATDRFKNSKIIKLRKESDNISSIHNDSFARSDAFGSTSMTYFGTNRQSENNGVLDQSIDAQKQSLQTSFAKNSQFAPKSASNMNSERKSTYFRQIQNFVGNEKQDDPTLNTKSQQISNGLPEQGSQFPDHQRKGRKSSLEFLEPEYRFQSPILNPSSQQPQNTLQLSQFKNSKIQQYIQSDQGGNQTKRQNRNISHDQNLIDKQIKQNFQSQTTLEQQQQEGVNGTAQVLRQTHMNFIKTGLSNDSRFNKILRTPYKFTPKKNGKLKPLLPMQSPQQYEDQESVQNFNPFQTRRLKPSFNKAPAF